MLYGSSGSHSDTRVKGILSNRVTVCGEDFGSHCEPSSMQNYTVSSACTVRLMECRLNAAGDLLQEGTSMQGEIEAVEGSVGAWSG